MLYRGSNDPARLFTAARGVTAGLALLLSAAVYLLTRRLFGEGAALAALALWVFYPDGLAQGGIVSPDLPSALMIFISAVAALLWLGRPSWRSGLAGAIATGLALLTKHTALLLIPFWGILGLVAVVRWKSRARTAALGVLLFLGILVLTLWAGYFFHAQPEVGAQFGLPSLPLPAAYVAGFRISKDLIAHRLCYFLGGPHPGHPLGFFPLSLLLKTPAPLLILFFLFPFLTPIRKVWPLAVFPGLLFISALASPFPFGHRYLLAMFPFMAVAAGAGAAKLMDKVWDRVFLAVLMVWLAAGTLLQHPNHLAYFNEFAGAKNGVYRYFVDSSLDWGTQLPALKAWMERSGVKHVYLSYFGTTDPGAYGIPYTPLPAFHQDLYYPEKGVAHYTLPRGAWIAVSVTNLVGLYQPRYFSRLVPVDRPDAVVGQSIFLWKMPASWDVSYDSSKNPPWEFTRADEPDSGT